jgi:cobalt-zinc-cadmium efflux system outer membrane protein
MRMDAIHRAGRRGRLRLAFTLTLSVTWASAAAAQPPSPGTPQLLPRDAAVHYALQNNPVLQTVRKQRGYGEASVIIAQTYPYNPAFTGYVTSAEGPNNAGITNRVYQEYYITLELELRGQGGHRKAGAAATVSRIEYEICQQELALSIAVIKAYNAVLYRTRKLEFLDELLRINTSGVDQLKTQVDAGKAKATDLTLARIDLDTLRAQRGQARTALAIARSDLRKLLGSSDDGFGVFGDLDVPLPSTEAGALTQMALEQRPDLKARRAAIGEAEAAMRLVVANRYGNLNLGPYYEYDPTRISYLGARIGLPLPVLNTKRGEIYKAETDVAKVRSEVQQLELQASLDVQAALSRLADASTWASAYATEVVPTAARAKQEFEGLYAKQDAAVTFANILTVQRAHLKATETWLDARYEVSLAEADLALAVAEPALALGPHPATEMPELIPPPR